MGKTPIVNATIKISNLLKPISLTDIAKYKKIFYNFLYYCPKYEKSIFLLISYLLILNYSKFIK